MSSVTNYLRLAMMFSDNHATTFISNLEKMIELVLNTNSPRAMMVEEIVTALSTEYNLNFTDMEVTRAIEGKRGKERIACINLESKKHSERKYILTQKAHDNIENKVNQSAITRICSLFLSEHPTLSIDISTMQELISRYFYRCFNSNATTIMQLLKQQYKDGVLLSNQDEEENFSDDEKGILNNFIFWENDEKDKFVYQMVSCCFDYCTMTAKKDPTVYETVFKNKCFILDTNIIFRIIGINRNNRKLVIDSFLKKCKEVGITLAVTNITRDEIHNTIKYNLDKISELIGSSTPVRTQYVKGCATNINEDFYQFYYEWCKRKGIKSGNIAGFRDELLKTADRVCQQFQNITFSSFDTISKDKFTAYTKDLLAYKSNYKSFVREETVQTDVNNFMYVVGMNDKSHALDFFALSYFHISADHIFCNWVKHVRAGAIPEVILPSVWYSIILHYSGRAADNNDYSAFTRFLYFSMNTNDEFKDEKKTVLLKMVSRLNEPVDVKEEIIFDVGKKLSGDFVDIDDETIAILIGESNKTITEQRVAKAIETQKQISQRKIDKQIEDNNAVIGKLTEKHEKEIAQIKDDIQQMQNEHDNKFAQQLVAQEEAVFKAKKEVRSNHIEIEAKENAKRKKIVYTIIILLTILLPLCAVGYVIYMILTGALQENKLNLLGTVGGIITGIWEFAVYKLLYENCFCELKLDKLVECERNKLEEKYPKV